MDESNLKITNDLYFKNFINTKRLSKSTERVYLGRIKSFCEFLGKTPSELIKEAQYGTEQRIDEYFNNYIENLKNSGRSSITITNQLDTVKAFYNEYGIDIEAINHIISPRTR